MRRSEAQSHDGVAVVVPVDDEGAAAQNAHEPRHRNPRQPRRILGKIKHYVCKSAAHLEPILLLWWWWWWGRADLHQDVRLQLHGQQNVKQLHRLDHCLRHIGQEFWSDWKSSSWFLFLNFCCRKTNTALFTSKTFNLWDADYPDLLLLQHVLMGLRVWKTSAFILKAGFINFFSDVLHYEQREN